MSGIKTPLKSLLLLAATSFMFSCSKDNSNPNPAPTGSNILKGTISSDLTLVNGGGAVDYYLEEIVTVEARLVIEPGTVIVAKAGSGLEFSTAKGILKAEGTAAKPIVFKSESGAKGGWLGIKFQDSNNPLNVMQYVTVADGGSASFDGDDSKKATIQFAGTNQLKMKNCTVSNSANWGMYETYSSDLTLIDFDSNTFSNHANFPIYVFDATAKDLGYKTSFSSNTKNYIGLMQKNFDGLSGDHIWKKQAVPYFWDDTDPLVIGYYTTNGNLTMEAGAQLVMGPGTGIVIGDNANETGYLKLQGTSANKVVIKGESSTKGYWKGIYVRTGSVNNDFTYASVSDAGSTNLGGTGTKANIVVDANSTLKLTNVTLMNSLGCGYTVSTTMGIVISSAMTYTNNTAGNECTF
jgi:hypothetical protein